MPAGAAVIRYAGARRVTWRIKYRDANNTQIQETLGNEAEGWTRRKAKAELRARLVAVEREGRVKVKPLTFNSFSAEWIDTYPKACGLKRSTQDGYASIIDRHLRPAFGHLQLEALDTRKVEQYVAARRQSGFGPRTVNTHLNLLNSILSSAVRDGVMRTNPVSHVKRPRAPRRRWTILSPAEIVRVEKAFGELAAEAEGSKRRWCEQALAVFRVLVGVGLRRSEILGLRWRYVYLADPDGPRLRVQETWVYGREDTPKSERGERTIALGKRLADVLWEHRGRSSFDGDDERVFCNPETGSVLDHKRFATTLKAALQRAKVERPMRPFHDGRHTAITNAAAAGLSPAALMARAGHSDFSTTQLYIDLSGEMFRDEAEQVEDRIWGSTGTKKRYKSGGPSPTQAT